MLQHIVRHVADMSSQARVEKDLLAPDTSEKYGDGYKEELLPNRFTLPCDNCFEGEFVGENIRDTSAEDENEVGDIEHGIKREGTGERVVNKFLFGSTSESNSNEDDDKSGKEVICDNFNTAGEEERPRNKQKIISHCVSRSPNEI